jgi:hypothetical protein
VETIEADEIDLVATTAKMVRGREVKIGAGCDLARVEYSESLTVDPKAKVGEEVKG